jgi:hypothetical protein
MVATGSRRRRRLAALFGATALLPVVPDAMALDRYLCMADQAVGFRRNGDAWITANPSTERRYVVEEIEPRTVSADAYNAIVTLENGDYVFRYCDKIDVVGDIIFERVFCEAGDRTFAMDHRDLRYFLAEAGGYLAEDPNQREEPARLEIGRCTKVQD